MDSQKIVIASVLAALTFAPVVEAREPSYEKIVKRWTRHDEVFTWDNFEARLIWNATYLSEDVRTAQRRKLADLLEWTDAELSDRARRDAQEEGREDVFFVSIYAGSSAWPEVGKDEGSWRVLLDTGEGEPRVAQRLERISVTHVERILYPYLDKWSHFYRVSFPKTIHEGSFRLRLAGIPARSELVWKP